MMAYSNQDLLATDRSKLPSVHLETADATPIRQCAYRRAKVERDVIEKMVQELLDAGMIQPSKSPWASPVVLQKKKDGKWRFCVDYRKLNAVTKKDAWPLPLISDALDRIGGNTSFITFDFLSGYHLLPMDECCREKTAFITHAGLYEYNVLPFGLSTAPAIFQRCLDSILGKLRWTSCFVYMDDIIISGTSFEELVERAEEVMSTLEKYGLKLNVNKCFWAHQELDYLGHTVSAAGIKPKQSNVQKILDFAVPKNQTQVRAFLGLSSYYRSFIEDYSRIARPLYDLTRALPKFEWNDDAQRSFDILKSALVNPPIRTHFSEECEHALYTDASGTGLGAILKQKEFIDGQPVLKVIAYWGRGLSKCEKNYSATELELLAVVDALNYFRPYCYGRHIWIVTDHQALLAMNKGTLASHLYNKRVTKYDLAIREYNLTFMYKKGKEHTDADTISRMEMPVGEPSELDESKMFFCRYSDSQAERTPVSDLSGKFDWRDLQSKDPFCQMRIAQLKDSSFQGRSRKKFVVYDGLLYRVHKEREEDEGGFCLVIPESVLDDVIFWHHNPPTRGHMGQFRTTRSIREKYWSPHLKESVIDYIRRCRDCQERKRMPGAAPRSTVSRSFPEEGLEPFQLIAFDIIDLANHQCRSRARYIFVCVDYLTGFVIAKSYSNMRAATVRTFLAEEVAHKVSYPQIMISDNGTQLRSATLADFCKESGIQQRFVTRYHPQANGKVERMNGQIKAALSQYVNSAHTNWVEYLSAVTYAINTSVNRTTGYSPFFLLYGRLARHPFDNATDARRPLVAGELEEDPEGFSSRMKKIWKEVAERVRREGEKYSEKTRKGRLMPVFHVGDRVWMKNPKPLVTIPGKAHKFLKLYDGPFIVSAVTSPVSYQVQDAKGNITRVNGDCLKKYWREDEEVLVPTRISSSDDTRHDVSDPILQPEEAHPNQETDADEPVPMSSIPIPELPHDHDRHNTSPEINFPTTSLFPKNELSPIPSPISPESSADQLSSSSEQPTTTATPRETDVASSEPSTAQSSLPSLSQNQGATKSIPPSQEADKVSSESATTRSVTLNLSPRRRSQRIQDKRSKSRDSPLTVTEVRDLPLVEAAQPALPLKRRSERIKSRSPITILRRFSARPQVKMRPMARAGQNRTTLRVTYPLCKRSSRGGRNGMDGVLSLLPQKRPPQISSRSCHRGFPDSPAYSDDDQLD